MPSSEGEVTTTQVTSDEQRDANSRLQDTTMAQVAPEVVIGRSPARINPKRKPDKSKIFRIRTSEADEPYICPYCRVELVSREQLEEHRLTCGREPPVLPVPDTPRAPPHHTDHPDEVRRHQDVANNNQAHALKAREAPEPATPESRESSVDRNNGYDSDSNPVESGSLAQIRQLLAQSAGLPQVGPIAQQLAQSNLALEVIQNTRMALAQFATSAMNSNTNTNNNPQTMQEFALLQGTLYTLQHQQMMQLQLIQQLQAQLSIKSKEGSPGLPNFPEGESKNASEAVDRHEKPSTPPPVPRPPPPPTSDSSHGVSSSFISSLMERFKVPTTNESSASERPLVSSPLCAASTSGPPPPPPPPPDPRDRPISPPMTASSIASSVIQHTDPPPPDEPNTLEMLQRTANNVLNSASQGLLTNRLIDDHKPSDGKDPYYKHRCRYCGKVFGSDSALQIHIRSHTGERPFKCNVCGNRFTTKGNLKVHFQRHQARFPHVKMNPHPVPEHLDKFHPPLLAQLGELKDFPSPPTGPPNPFTSLPTGPALPPYRLPGPPPSLDLHRPFNLLNLARQGREEEPENLSISEPRSSPDSLDRNFKAERVDSNRMEVDEALRSPHFETKSDADDRGSAVDMADESQASDSTLKNDKLFDMEKRFDQEKSFDSEKRYEEEKSLESEKRYDGDDRSSEERALAELKKLSEDSALEESSAFNKKYDTDKFEGDKFEGDKFEEDKLEGENKFEEDKYEGDKLDNDSNFERERELSKESFLDSKEMRTLMEKKSPERDLTSDQTPLDIRIRTERELKDNDGGGGGGHAVGGVRVAKEEHDRDSSDARSVTSEQPTDLRMRPDFRQLGLPTIPFSGPRMPLNFPFLPGLPTSFPGPMGPPPNLAVPPGIDPAKDPQIYTNLLPKPGSTDNSWEALIEIQKTSETMKLEQLVNNIENKLTDPNQCVICHRVLSCKSALQMHYRTHTGERPFKCKICGRAFTTKGNLKTHMGVHRAKPPMRMLHQCPVCHKKYTNALVLQQHIRQHTGEPTDLSPEQIAAAEVRDYPHLHTPTSLPQMMPSGFPLPPPPLQGFPPLPLHLRFQLSPEAMRHREMIENEERATEEEKYLRPFSTSSRSSSTGSAEQRTAEDLTMRAREDSFNGMTSPRVSVSPTPSDYSDIGDRSHDAPGDSQVSPSDPQQALGSAVSPAVSTGSQDGGVSLPLDLVSRPQHLYSPFGLFPPPLTTAAMTPGTPSLPGLNPLFLPNLPGRGNTTCQLCFKTFACQSALEIHIRSHTKERPFKCSICDRGFSTKGNMKQHMLTHKIRDGCRDLPLPHDAPSKHNGTGVSTPDNSSTSPSLTANLPLALPPSLVTSLPATLASPLPTSLHSPLPTSLHSPLPTSLHSPLPTSIHSPLPTSIHSPLPPSLPPAVAAALLHQAREEEKMVDFRVKREREGENALPVPKRPSGPGCEGDLLEGTSPEAEPQPTPEQAPCPSPAPDVMPLTRT